jgi:hypothetical protein
MNEIENIDLAKNLPSEGEETKEEIKYSDEIKKMLQKIRALKDRLQRIGRLWNIPEVIIFDLEATEQSLLDALKSPEIFQDNPEYYDALKQDFLDLQIRVETVIKNCTPFGYTSLNENSTVEELRKIEAKKEEFTKKLESYFPVKDVSKLKIIKDECADDMDFFFLLLCKILVINAEHFGLQNYEALERLELEKECWDEIANYYEERLSCSSYKGSIKPPELNEFVTIAIRGLYGKEHSKSFDFRQRVDCLYSLTKMLMDNYGDDIKINFRIEVQEDLIDFLIKLPDKRVFAMMIRSYNKNYVRWDATKKDFYVFTVKSKDFYKWTSPARAISKLKSIFLLKKVNSSMLGETKAEKNAHINKVIILASGTEIDKTSNDPDLWVVFGKAPALKIYTDTLTYVVEQRHLIDFLALPEK